MKKSKIFSGIAMLLFLLSGWAAEYHVTCRITAPDLKKVMICDGERFHRVGSDGICEFTLNTECEPFLYLYFPDEMKADGAFTKALKPGKNEFSFTLKKRLSIPDAFTFIHGSDIQYDFQQKRGELRNDMEELRDIIKEHKCTFITFPGDMTEFGEPHQLKILKEELDRADFPHFPIWGGHDGLRSKPKLKNFTQIMGAPYYSWNYAGIHFIAPISEVRLLTAPERERQFKWIEADLALLAPGTPVIIVTHDPLYLGEQMKKSIAGKKLRLLAWLGAHYHFDNTFLSGGIPSFYNAPLRSHDSGTFTKKVRLIRCSARDGIPETKMRYLNQRKRIHAVLDAKNRLTAFLYDTVHAPEQARCIAPDGQKIQLKQVGEFIWTAKLPETFRGKKLKFEVEAATGKWSAETIPSSPKELLWSHPTGNTFHHYPVPSVHGDKLFLGLSAGNRDKTSGGVLCLDRMTGKQLWRVQQGVNVSSAVTDGKAVYALTNEGELLTLDCADGRLLRKQTPEFGTLKESHAYWRLVQVPMRLVNGKLLIHLFRNGAGYLQYFDPVTGKALWEKPVFLGFGERANAFNVADGRIYFIGTGCYGALDLNSGTDIWRTNERIKSSKAAPVIAGNAVYYYLRASLRKVDPATGKIIWKQGMPGSVNSIGGITPAPDGKLLAFSTNAIINLEDATGKRLNRVNLQPLPASAGSKYQFLANTAAPVTVNDKVIIAGDDGGVYRVDPATARPTAILSTGSAFKGDPAVAGDMIYLTAFDGTVYALQIK
ncbi:MAG TPA: hypothetical protein DE060_06895 [Lentisphaeria bacterium]|nr:hypothetical protein [Lentisphaeria bacterium]HCG48918.1 hypothetical protein [Lentisphaeria bacterium]